MCGLFCKTGEEECTLPFFYQISIDFASHWQLLHNENTSAYSRCDFFFFFTDMHLKCPAISYSVKKRGSKSPDPLFVLEPFQNSSKFNRSLLWPLSHPYTRVCENHSAVLFYVFFLRNPRDTLTNKPTNIQKWVKTRPPWPR